MSARNTLCTVIALAASTARRVSHGLLFVAGGVRRIDDFRLDSASYFADFNAERTEIEGGFNALEARVYGRAVRAGARIAVIGCGSGRDLLPFLIAGHDVVGMEPALPAVEAARREVRSRGYDAPVLHGFIEDQPLPGMFDAIILSPHCYSYVPGSGRRVAMLRQLASHLNADGRIAINFLRRTGSWSHTGVRLAALAARLTGSDCPWEPHDVVQLNEINGRRTITFEHFFLPEEVAAEAERAGLRVIDHEVDDFLGPITVVGR